MEEVQHEVEAYLSHVGFPASKEELINGLLARNAPGRMIALVERLPQDHYQGQRDVRHDLEEVSHVHSQEVAPARTYDDFLAVVLRHVGDIHHTSKEAYNRIVEHVIHIAEQQGTLDRSDARAMEQRLDAAFADLRGTMSEVYDYRAPINPRQDLPRERE
ncbi:MAG: DUF2795 domain-containing protein [Chloroflexota bacterium]|nr:MAG: hypothetical protein DLM70_12415 [Chloroflexota bacterium]